MVVYFQPKRRTVEPVARTVPLYVHLSGAHLEREWHFARNAHYAVSVPETTETRFNRAHSPSEFSRQQEYHKRKK